jgi:hypothetical protein
MRIDLVGDAESASNLAATLSGWTAPVSGALHVLGHALPSDSGPARQGVSVWSRSDADLLDPLGQILEQRLAWSDEPPGRKSRIDAVQATITRLNTLSQALPADTRPAVISEHTRPGTLPRAQQILVFAAAALMNSSPVSLISPVDPVSSDEERELWWMGIDEFAGPSQTVALCVSPPARALPRGSTRTVVDLSEAALQAGGVQ